MGLKTKKLLFFLALGNLILLPLVSSANGLVPCGPGTDKPVCEFCDLFVMFDNIIHFLLKNIVPPLAALMIAIGGFMYILAYAGPAELLEGGKKGGPKMLSQAKTLFKSVIFGLLIIYGAWVIIGTFLLAIGLADWTYDIYHNWWEKGFFEIECETTVPAHPSGPGVPSGPPPPSGPPSSVSLPITGEIITNPVGKLGTGWLSSDEITIDATVKNTSKRTRKYFIKIKTIDGKWAVASKGLTEVGPGKTAIIQATTAGDLKWDIGDFKDGKYIVELYEFESGRETLLESMPPSDIPSH